LQGLSVAMDSPPLPCLFLHGAKREMAFCSGFSRSRVHIIFKVETEALCEAVVNILGENYMADSARARVNSEVASWFVSQLLLTRGKKVEAKVIAECFIKPQHRLGLEEALTSVNLVPPLQDAGMDGISLDEAKRVIAALSTNNSTLMKFVEDIHNACAARVAGGSRIKCLDLPGLSSPILLETEVMAKFRHRVGFSYNFLLRVAQERLQGGWAQ
ncbi:hypothetical protein KI387_039840, partial [Taxus chinensis]